MKINLPTKSDQVEQWGPIDIRLLYASFWFAPMSGAVKSKWEIYWAEMVGIIEKDKGVFYWWKNSLEKEGAKSIKKWLIDDKKRKGVAKDYWKVVGEIKKVIGDFEALDKNADFEQIQKLALTWHSLYYKFWGVTDVFEVANYGAPGYLKAHLKSLVPESELESVMEVLLAPDELSFNQQSERELFECVLKAKSTTELILLTQKHASKWHWLDNSYYQSKRLSPIYFFNKAKKLSKKDATDKLEEIKKYRLTIKNKKAAIIKKVNLPTTVVKLASALSFSIWMQDHRKGIAWWSSDVATQFSKHLAKYTGAALEDILHYSADEWKESFASGKKLSDKIYLQRKNKLYAMYSRRGFYTFLTGAKAKTIANHFNSIQQKAQTNTLSGVVVSKGSGIITGKVRVLTSALESKNMKQGEILVTAMTSPDYINAMRKAKAIITDVGGLMSHAAVVSRELGIPCIVNTKHATKLLKNGDQVQIDCEKGIIEKLN